MKKISSLLTIYLVFVSLLTINCGDGPEDGPERSISIKDRVTKAQQLIDNYTKSLSANEVSKFFEDIRDIIRNNNLDKFYDSDNKKLANIDYFKLSSKEVSDLESAIHKAQNLANVRKKTFDKLVIDYTNIYNKWNSKLTNAIVKKLLGTDYQVYANNNFTSLKTIDEFKNALSDTNLYAKINSTISKLDGHLESLSKLPPPGPSALQIQYEAILTTINDAVTSGKKTKNDIILELKKESSLHLFLDKNKANLLSFEKLKGNSNFTKVNLDILKTKIEEILVAQPTYDPKPLYEQIQRILTAQSKFSGRIQLLIYNLSLLGHSDYFESNKLKPLDKLTTFVKKETLESLSTALIKQISEQENLKSRYEKILSSFNPDQASDILDSIKDNSDIEYFLSSSKDKFRTYDEIQKDEPSIRSTGFTSYNLDFLAPTIESITTALKKEQSIFKAYGAILASINANKEKSFIITSLKGTINNEFFDKMTI